ncbi:hypothetical protein K474DRAFT_55094 [Panus rudis PR-1116 ss-1]|nr:hypothetical protein K474DRAFT_55094 [Panus rudis PR-1116 ss-1]
MTMTMKAGRKTWSPRYTWFDEDCVLELSDVNPRGGGAATSGYGCHFNTHGKVMVNCQCKAQEEPYRRKGLMSMTIGSVKGSGLIQEAIVLVLVLLRRLGNEASQGSFTTKKEEDTEREEEKRRRNTNGGNTKSREGIIVPLTSPYSIRFISSCRPFKASNFERNTISRLSSIHCSTTRLSRYRSARHELRSESSSANNASIHRPTFLLFCS